MQKTDLNLDIILTTYRNPYAQLLGFQYTNIACAGPNKFAQESCLLRRIC